MFPSPLPLLSPPLSSLVSSPLSSRRLLRRYSTWAEGECRPDDTTQHFCSWRLVSDVPRKIHKSCSDASINGAIMKGDADAAWGARCFHKCSEADRTSKYMFINLLVYKERYFRKCSRGAQPHYSISALTLVMNNVYAPPRRPPPFLFLSHCCHIVSHCCCHTVILTLLSHLSHR